MKRISTFVILTLMMVLLAACGGQNVSAPEPAADVEVADAPAADNAVAEADTEGEPVVAEQPAGDAETSGAEVTRPDWHFVSFTDVRTGQTLSFADLAGKTVFVEPMATWCTNCRRQLGSVAEAQAQLGGNEDVVFVALSVEPNMDDARLLEYTNANGFNWTFAKASPELLQGMVDAFGRTVTNPPSTPHFVIRPDGSMSELTTGFESAEDIINSLSG